MKKNAILFHLCGERMKISFDSIIINKLAKFLL